MKDGFVIFYSKNDTIYPVATSDEELDLLQLMIPMVFQGEKIKVIDIPQGTIENINSRTSKEESN